MKSNKIKNVALLVHIEPQTKAELSRETGASIAFIVRRILREALTPEL